MTIVRVHSVDEISDALSALAQNDVLAYGIWRCSLAGDTPPNEPRAIWVEGPIGLVKRFSRGGARQRKAIVQFIRSKECP